MSNTKRTMCLLACIAVVQQAKETACRQLPKDVEMLEGYESPYIYGRRSMQFDADTTDSDGFVKAVRNRRALMYIKATPSLSNDEEDSDTTKRVIKRSFHKRDLADTIANVDVAAQYMEQLAISKIDSRGKRDLISETDSTKIDENKNDNVEIVEETQNKVWIPQTVANEDVPEKEEPAVFDNPETLPDKMNGREARGATKDQWVKLPYVGRHIANEQLSTTQTEEVSRRLPRVNFVTQNKGLQASESRNQRESIPRGSFSRSSDLRTDIYPPSRDSRGRSLDYSSSYSRQSYYYPEDYYRRRGGGGYYEDPDYYDSDYYSPRRDPYYDNRNARRYDYTDYRYRGNPYDRYDDYGDSYSRYDRPKRIIYYATLPDVVRSPPNVYRYPNSRYDDDRYSRDRYDYNRGYYPRYPYSALKKSESEGPRDLSSSSSANNKNKDDNTKRQQDQKKTNDERARDASLNSHQYPIGLNANLNVDSSKPPQQTLYHDITRMDNDYHRYDHPSFQAAVDDPYVSRHD